MKVDLYDRLLSCIDGFYEAAVDSNHWTAALQSFNTLLSGNGAALLRFSDESEVVSADIAEIPHDALPLYQALVSQDIRLSYVSCVKPGELYNDGGMLARREFERTDVFNLVLKPIDIPYHLCLRLPGSGVSVAVVERSALTGPASQREEDLLRRLAPHIIRAARFQRIVDDCQDKLALFTQAFERFPQPVAMMGAQGRLVQTSEALDLLLRRADGLTLRNGRLRALEYRDDQHLQAAIAGAFQRDIQHYGSRSLAISRGEGRRPLGVHVIPLRHAGRPPHCLIFVQDPERMIDLGEQFAPRYGLTPAQTRLALLIIAGDNLTEAARRLGTSINTCKTHLKGIYRKTGAHDRVSLLRVFGRV